MAVVMDNSEVAAMTAVIEWKLWWVAVAEVDVMDNDSTMTTTTTPTAMMMMTEANNKDGNEGNETTTTMSMALEMVA